MIKKGLKWYQQAFSLAARPIVVANVSFFWFTVACVSVCACKNYVQSFSFKPIRTNIDAIDKFANAICQKSVAGKGSEVKPNTHVRLLWAKSLISSVDFLSKSLNSVNPARGWVRFGGGTIQKQILDLKHGISQWPLPRGRLVFMQSFRSNAGNWKFQRRTCLLAGSQLPTSRLGYVVRNIKRRLAKWTRGCFLLFEICFRGRRGELHPYIAATRRSKSF